MSDDTNSAGSMGDSVTARPSIYSQDYDHDRWSNHGRMSDGGRLSWRELAEEQEQELRRLRDFLLIVSDLDRCEHGRHEGDPCTLTDGCGGPSLGNPLMAGSPPRNVSDLIGRQIGFGLDGSPIVVPDGRAQRDPEAWRVPCCNICGTPARKGCIHVERLLDAILHGPDPEDDAELGDHYSECCEDGTCETVADEQNGGAPKGYGPGAPG